MLEQLVTEKAVGRWQWGLRVCEKTSCARDLAFRRCSESSCISTYTPVPALRRNATPFARDGFFTNSRISSLPQPLRSNALGCLLRRPAGATAKVWAPYDPLSVSIVPLEGITCVVCHRVPEAYGKITGRFPLEPGDIRNPIYGPRKGDELQRVLASHADDPPKTHRDARLLEQVSQPGFCARCHDVRLANGIRFEDLFSEYKQTPAAERGVTCQGCHMGPISGIPSENPPASAAVVRGVPTRPARRTNHMFAGPDSSVVHPGIFPINPEAQEFATPEEWLSFDVEAGWGSEAFEKGVPEAATFPGIWADREERIAAREIIDRQLELLAENRARATTLLRNGYGLGEVRITAKDKGLEFDVEVKNLTDGHSVPSGLIAERNVFLQVTVTDADGTVVFRSGDLDPNGDVRDTHSLYVHNGAVPRDEQLFNLRSPILVRTIHGGEREQVMPANYALNPLVFMRPSDTPAVLFGGIRDLRLQKKNIEALGHRGANYHVVPKLLTGRTPYRLNVKLVAGQLPPHLIHAISGVGFEYGLTARCHRRQTR